MLTESPTSARQTKTPRPSSKAALGRRDPCPFRQRVSKRFERVHPPV